MTRFSKLGLFLLFAGSLAAQQTVQYGYDAAGRLISASYDNGTAISYTYDAAGNLLRRDVTSGAPFATVSAASFEKNVPLAAEMIVSGFGLGLATGIDVGRTIPLPTELLGTSVDVTDSQGVTRPAPLFFRRATADQLYDPRGHGSGRGHRAGYLGRRGELRRRAQYRAGRPQSFRRQ